MAKWNVYMLKNWIVLKIVMPIGVVIGGNGKMNDDVIDFCKYAGRNDWGPSIYCNHPDSELGRCKNRDNCKLKL